MIETVRKLLALFSVVERRQLAGVFASILGMGVFQIAGIGAVIPFVGLLGDHSLIHKHAALAWTYNTLGFSSVNGFLIFLGIVVLVLLVVSNAFIAFTIWLMARFAWDNQRRLSTRLLQGYLAQPYEAYLGRNSAETGKNILVECQQMANGVLMPVLNLAAFGITVLAIIGFLFWLNPLVAALALFTFGSGYGAIYLFVRRPLYDIGRRRMQANVGRFKAVNEAFGSVKEVKVLGCESTFVEAYRPHAYIFARSMANQNILSQLPRYAIQSLALGLVMAVFLLLLVFNGGVQSVLPVAGGFAVAGYRLLPALQRVYQGISALRFNRPVLDTLYHDLVDIALAQPPNSPKTSADAASVDKPLAFNQEVRLENVRYAYPESGQPALDGIDLCIPRNRFVAFVGTTGAGKTTLADVLLGVLVPQQGAIRVDDVAIGDHNRRNWQANIGYVPQEIYLIDDTIAANIAFGVPPAERSSEAIARAARIANIHDFITEQLPAGYETPVGERGVRISGGQRQRIGIARALYRDPQVLVLDEATSALDNKTEQRIVEELDAMRGGRTLIVIAHRLTTVQKCSQLYMLDAGRIVAQGTYSELMGGSDQFKRLAVGA